MRRRKRLFRSSLGLGASRHRGGRGWRLGATLVLGATGCAAAFWLAVPQRATWLASWLDWPWGAAAWQSTGGIAPGAVTSVGPMANSTIIAEPRAVAVVDGDTLRLHETVIRLAGVTAPRRGDTCHAADGSAYDCGNAAAVALGQLVSGHPVACRVGGRDGHGLLEADCDAGGTPVNRALILAGWARAGEADGPFSADEETARAARRGVWRGGQNQTF